MSCCVNCFNSERLKTYIDLHGVLSKCNYCKSEKVKCINEKELHFLFSDLFDLYCFFGNRFDSNYKKKNDTPETNTLVRLIQNDWNIFDEEKLDDFAIAEIIFNITSAKKFLIINQTESLRKIWFRSSERYYGYFSNKDWDVFCNNIKHKNRFYHEFDDNCGFNPNEVFNHEVFINAQGILKKDTLLYRAREGYTFDRNNKIKKAFPARQMRIPPINIISNGRANPQGINYLYTSDQKATVLSEVRAWKGAIVSVAHILVKKNLSIVDLTYINNSISPFEAKLNKKIQIKDILKAFANDLSKPINPNKSKLDYLPTQYICELIKNYGYEGIKFKSSLGDGNNIVLFNSKGIRIDKVDLVRVKNISYEYEDLS